MGDDDREVRAKRAAALELAQRLVVALDDVQTDFGGEVVRLSGGQMMPAAHLAHDRIDDRKIGEEERFVLQKRSREPCLSTRR